MTPKLDPYRSCKHIKREQPDVVIDQELLDKIGQNYRTLPIFQQGVFENTLKKHYSLRTNELLKCRWRQYKKHFDERVFAPFQFLDIRDYHFYNQRNQLLPSLSVHTKTNHRKSLKPGPSVDAFGSRPIPQDLLMKRSGREDKPAGPRRKRDQGKQDDQKPLKKM